MEQKPYAVAVDGPSGAGKSTLAKAVARELGITYVDTGAIYRTVALAAIRRGVHPGNAVEVAPLLPELVVRMGYGADGSQAMYLNGEEVTEEIRSPEVSMAASAVSALPEVRAFLLDLQRATAAGESVIMDGRDIGTVVLPNAAVKVFLTASPEVRAKRRFLELAQRGMPRPYDEVLAELVKRDYDDSHRAAAPLRQAEDAVLLDTSEMNFEQSVAALLRIIRERT